MNMISSKIMNYEVIDVVNIASCLQFLSQRKSAILVSLELSYTEIKEIK
ncbi:MAG: hypothetical protein VB074_11075 [Proteiniphilum sp.]|nr:hypothetical protein [Proteiniphilum sp.]